MAHAHDHEHHDHGLAAARHGQRNALTIALAANASFLVAEVVGGIAFGSLALLADAAHMLSDVVALSIALVAQRLIDRPATARHSYGLQRAEVLAAQANGVTLLAAAGWIAYTAIQRLDATIEVDGPGLLAVAAIGLAVNVASAVLLARAQGTSLNMRGAYMHMVMDAAGSVAAIVAGVAVTVWGADVVDPLASLAIAALVVWSSWGLLRETTHVFLEAVPRGMDPAAVEQTLLEDVDVEAVHHLHLWNLASDVPALSAHVVLAGDKTLHDAQASGERLKAALAADHGILHATLELECHPCDPAEDEAPRMVHPHTHGH
jgi:cobalt-zinc-cadmium efflux system protein